MNKNIIILFLLFGSLYMQAQQNAQFSQFMWTKLSYNPAYAGSSEYLSMTALHRSQWVGMEGAPTSQTISAHAPFFKKKVGVGLNISHDNITISDNWNLGMSYSYRMKINQGVLSIGLEGAMKYINVDWSKAQTVVEEDVALPSMESQQLFPDISFGLFYQKEKFFAGLSVQNLIRANVNKKDGETLDVVPTDRHHYYAMTGAVFNLSNNFKLSPMLLISYVDNAPIQIDLNATLIFMEKFWLGASYRKDDSVDAIIQYQINKQIRFGMAYDFTLSELQKVTKGSYELMLRYDFQYDKGKRVNIRFF